MCCRFLNNILSPSSQRALGSTPLCSLCALLENPSVCSQKSKQWIVYLYRDFLLLEGISHTFLHSDLYHSPEKGRVRIPVSSLQMGNFSSGRLVGLMGQGEERHLGIFPTTLLPSKVTKQSSHYSQDRLWPAWENQTAAGAETAFMWFGAAFCDSYCRSKLSF